MSSINIAKHSVIGNCPLMILNNKDVSDGVKSIFGINPIIPICDPLEILNLILYGLLNIFVKLSHYTVQISNGSHIGIIGLIPRIDLTPSETSLSSFFRMIRGQFPMTLCFAMLINDNLYPIEFLNSLNVQGFPLHKLELQN